MPWWLTIHTGWWKLISEVHVNKRIGFRGAENTHLYEHQRKRKAWCKWQRKNEAWRDDCDGYIGRISIIYKFEGEQGDLGFDICISVVHVETTTWKKQEAPQYADSLLTDLIGVKPVAKDTVLTQESAAETQHRGLL